MQLRDIKKAQRHPVHALFRKSTNYRGRGLAIPEIREFADETGMDFNKLLVACKSLAEQARDGGPDAFAARARATELALKFVQDQERADSLLDDRPDEKPNKAAAKAVVDKILEEDPIHKHVRGLKFEDGTTL